MPHHIAYSDHYGQTFGSRTVEGDDAVVDRILARTGWFGTVTLDAELPHIRTILVNSYARRDDASGKPPGNWRVEVHFQWPALKGDVTWFTYNLCTEQIDRDAATVAEIVGFPVRLDAADRAGAAVIEFWYSDNPGGAVSWPASPALTYRELFSIAVDLDAYLRAVSEAAVWMSSGIQSVPSPGPRRGDSKVFLCHSSRDKLFARRLARALREAGVDVWLDEDEILVGHDFVEMMGRGLQKARFVVAVLSPNFVDEGPWAREELRHALERQVSTDQVVLLPVLLADCEIPPLMRSKRYADFRDSFELGLERLLRSIAGHAPASG
jgi:hypothetical protein